MASANGTFDPNFPAAALVKKLQKDAEKTHVDALIHLANLSVPVLGATAKPDAIDAAVEQTLASGLTTEFFSKAFAMAQSGTLTREELDQRMINWALKMPELRDKFNDLPDNVKTVVEEFRKCDLSQGLPAAAEFKMPASPYAAKKMEGLTANLGKTGNYPGVVENTGEPVQYVDKAQFVNWGETVKNIPAVHFPAIQSNDRLPLFRRVLLACRTLSSTPRRRERRCDVQDIGTRGRNCLRTTTKF